jgi:tripartite-type tricarboxylate transporter receptor subunit TctC
MSSTTTSSRLTIALVAAFGFAVFATSAIAQTYPEQTIRLIVPFAPGGGTDLTARIVAEDLTKRFGKPVIVENKPGAQTAVGLDLTAKSKPDGYTMMWATSDGMAFLPALKDDLSFNMDKDFEYVATTMKYSLVLSANPKLPVKTMSELQAYGKANPGKLTYAGAGTAAELGLALIMKAIGVQGIYVPFGGSAPSVAAAVNGTTDMVLNAPASGKEQILAGQLRAIALTDTAPNPSFPGVPTLIETGLPELKNESILLFNGVLAPAGTPAPIIERWRTELQASLKDPGVIARLAKIEYVPDYRPGAEFKSFMQKEKARWGEVAKANNIKLAN